MHHEQAIIRIPHPIDRIKRVSAAISHTVVDFARTTVHRIAKTAAESPPMEAAGVLGSPLIEAIAQESRNPDVVAADVVKKFLKTGKVPESLKEELGESISTDNNVLIFP